MRVNELKYEENKNLGSYESRKVGVTVVIEDGETLKDAVDRVQSAVEYYLNKPERDAKKAKYVAELNALPEGEASANRRTALQTWLAKYAAATKEAESLGL
jgi:hypothetical protein